MIVIKLEIFALKLTVDGYGTIYSTASSESIGVAIACPAPFSTVSVELIITALSMYPPSKYKFSNLILIADMIKYSRNEMSEMGGRRIY